MKILVILVLMATHVYAKTIYLDQIDKGEVLVKESFITSLNLKTRYGSNLYL